MKPPAFVRRWLSAGATLGIFALVVLIASQSGSPALPTKEIQTDLRQRAERQDWPMLGGSPSRNMVQPWVRNLPSYWNIETGENIRWAANLGSHTHGGPVVSGGKVFVGTNNGNARNLRDKTEGGAHIDRGIVMCFREADGNFLWQAVHDKLVGKQVNDWPQQGIASTPVVEGNRLYYVSNRAEVICADPEGFLDGRNDGVTDEQYRDPTDADIIWRLDMIKELQVFPHNLANCSPLIVGELLFVVTSNGVEEGHVHLPSPKAPSFLAIHKKTGQVAWQSNAPTVRQVGLARVPDGAPTDKLPKNQEGVVMHAQWSNPTFAWTDGIPQIIFPGGDGWLRAYEPATGKLLWKFDGNLKAGKYELGGKGTRSDFLGTPAVYGQKLYIGTGQDPEHYEGEGHLWCIDLAKALEKGRTNKDRDVSIVNDNLDPRAAVNKDSALVWHYGGPRPQPADRDFIYGRTMSTCAVQDGLVYAAELAGYLHCLDADTGKPYWVHDVRSAIWSSPFWVDGKVYLANEDGDVYVFAHGKKKNLLDKMEMDSSPKTVLAAANGTLYIATEAKLYAIGRK